MSIGDYILADRAERRMSQADYARHLNMDRTVLSRIETGERECPPVYDQALARMDYKLALEIIDERTGGFIGNILGDNPHLDLHPAALKEVLMQDLDDLEEALEGLTMARHIDPIKRKASAERLWHELRDVLEKGMVMLGVMEEEFGLDRDRLSKEHEQQVKRGDR